MRILYVTTISLTMNSFFKPHIEMLVRDGHTVDIACNANELALDKQYTELGCNFLQVDFSRSPLSSDNIKAYRQLKKLIQNGNYNIVHCHTPNASIITRLVCRKFRKRHGLKVFYTAHGFHFYKGAPLLNWLVFYSAEKFCSRFTDKLITINNEDYALAKEKFYTKEVHLVHGVGIDLSKFQNHIDKIAMRRSILVPDDAILLFSVGELNENKNHQIIINALSELNNPKIHYAIAGTGDQYAFLMSLAKKLGISKQVHFLGYRNDIPELNHTADIFCFPSFREGLSVALMEAMACGLPVVCSNIRGNSDLINKSGGKLFSATSVTEARNAILEVLESDRDALGASNKLSVKNYSIENVLLEMQQIYADGV